jgi:diacylglycerol kinase
MPRRNFAQSFRDAWAGLCYCVATQHNMQFHLLAAVAVLMVSYLLRLDRLEVALVLLAISLVLTAEMFNTSVEKNVDLFVTTYHPVARLAKDIAAAAVLVAAICAVVIGLLVFLPHLGFWYAGNR